MRTSRQSAWIAGIAYIALGVVPAFAQKTRTITGLVTDAKGAEIEWGSVIVLGGAGGTITTETGKFWLEVPRNADVSLCISSQRFLSQRVEVRKDTNEVSVMLHGRVNPPKGANPIHCNGGSREWPEPPPRTIRGRVTDSRTKGPLALAGVIAGSDGSDDQTDREGRFEFEEISGEVVLRFFRPGYLPREVRIGAQQIDVAVELVRRDYADSAYHYVTGKLVDAVTGKGINGYVSMAGMQRNAYGEEEGVSADVDGNFALVLPKSGAKVRASSLNYEDAEVFVAGDMSNVVIKAAPRRTQAAPAAVRPSATQPSPVQTSPAPRPAAAAAAQQANPATDAARAPAAPAPAAKPPTAEELLGQGWAAILVAADWKKAATLLSAAVQQAPGFESIEVQLADAKLESGDVDGAAAIYGKKAGNRESRGDVRGSVGMCRVFLAKGQLAEAMAACQNAMVHGEVVEARKLMGDVRARSGDLAGAIEHYQKAISLLPRYAPAYEGLHAVYTRQRDSARAAAALAKSRELTPGRDDAERAKKRREKLISSYVAEVAGELEGRWALQELNFSFAATDLLSSTTAKQKAEQAALVKERKQYLASRYQLAVDLDLENAEAYFRLAVATREADPGRSAGALQRAMELEPKNVSLRIWQASELQKRGDLTGEMNALQEAVRLVPQSVDAHLALARAYEARKDMASAVRSYRAAVQAEPKNVSARHNLALALRKNRDFAGALVEYREAARLEPNRAHARYLYAQELERAGDSAGALAEYWAGFRAEPKNAMAQGELTRALQKRGDTEGAIRVYREVAAADPKNGRPHQELAELLKKKGDHAGSLAEWRIAASLLPEDYMVHISLGWALLQAGDNQGALQALKKAVLIAPEVSFARDQYNQQAVRMGLAPLKPRALPAP